MCVTRLLQGVYKSACSVAATYKPPMLVPRVRLPAGASHLIAPWTAARNTVFCMAFTMFFTRLLQCLFTRLSQCFLRRFYKIVTMLYKFIRLSQGFNEVSTTSPHGFSQCFLQGFQKVFTMCSIKLFGELLEDFQKTSRHFLQWFYEDFKIFLQGFCKACVRFLLGFYKAFGRVLKGFWKAFTRCLEGFEKVSRELSGGF